MKEPNGSKKMQTISVRFGATQVDLTEIPSVEGAPGKIRLSCYEQDPAHTLKVDLSESELVDLLQKAIRAGILSPDFLTNLNAEFEI